MISKRDPSPSLKSAGKTWQVRGESTAGSLQFTSPPPTPTHVKAYRKSSTAALGKTAVHHGRARDPALPDRRFGSVNDYSVTAATCLSANAGRAFESQREALAEGVYLSSKKEPLGRCPKSNLPDVVTKRDVPFGVQSKTSENAKSVIYAVAEAAIGAVVRDNREPGVQKTRKYDWSKRGIDPTKHRFGSVPHYEGEDAGSVIHSSDAAQPVRIVQSQVADFKGTFADSLGRTKNLGFGSSRSKLPADHSYGKTIPQDEWNARACMANGGNSAEPDETLGKSVVKSATLKKLSRNAPPPDPNRSFGMPTIRTDKPKPKYAKVTNNTNFGDDAGAAALLYPSPYLKHDVHQGTFAEKISLDELQALNKRVNLLLSEAEVEQAYHHAAKAGMVSVESFRKAVDELGL